MTAIRLGCIADDFTGATDLANNLVRAGMRVVQTIGVPPSDKHHLPNDVDAVVVALKSRTIEPGDAIRQSLAALSWLKTLGSAQYYFKYCSTFDSTPQGNIGPVTEALMAALDTDFTIATPAFPDNARTVFKGHLFVGESLLSDSGMQHHPLTPMTDANLVRVLQAQCQGSVGLIDFRAVAAGAEAVTARIAELRAEGVRVAVVDAVSNADLMRLGVALKGMPLVTAGSGVAIGLPQNFGITARPEASALPAPQGLQAVVSGSCSGATQRQVRAFIDAGGAAFEVDSMRVAGAQGQDPGGDAVAQVAAEALAWAQARLGTTLGSMASPAPVLIYSTADPAAVQAVQSRFGVAAAGEAVERCLATVARGLVGLGVGQFVVAGGETSGACVQALGITQLQIGPQIDPGVPWCHAPLPLGAQGTHAAIHLTLKSGNFGTDDFFMKAFAQLGRLGQLGQGLV
jgi:3-dehydrotetronate 4-kinase